MAKYAASWATPAGTNLTIVALGGHATQRARLYDFVVGSDATPADIATRYYIYRVTAGFATLGGTSITPAPLSDDFSAALTVCKGGTVTEPTYATVALLQVALNQRATFRWVAAPGGEFLVTAGTANGIGVRSINSGGTPNTNTSVHFEE